MYHLQKFSQLCNEWSNDFKAPKQNDLCLQISMTLFGCCFGKEQARKARRCDSYLQIGNYQSLITAIAIASKNICIFKTIFDCQHKYTFCCQIGPGHGFSHTAFEIVKTD